MIEKIDAGCVTLFKNINNEYLSSVLDIGYKNGLKKYREDESMIELITKDDPPSLFMNYFCCQDLGNLAVGLFVKDNNDGH